MKRERLPVALKLRHWRLTNGMTLEAAGHKLGFPASTISAYECGRVVPNEGSLDRIARLTGISKEMLRADSYVSPGVRNLATAPERVFEGFGPRLVALRQSKRMTQMELRLQAGLADKVVAYLESGQRAPKFKTVRRLAAALQVPVEELLP